MNKQHWQDWVTGVVGVWLIASPWIVPIALPQGSTITPVAWNFVLTGAVSVGFAIAALRSYRTWEEWVDAAVGVWLILSPWALHFTAAFDATANAVVAGVIIVGAAAWNMADVHWGGTAT